MRIKPAKGCRVKDPVTHRHIPEGGIEVSDTDLFWLRRLMHGDVEKVVDASPVEADEARPVDTEG